MSYHFGQNTVKQLISYVVWLYKRSKDKAFTSICTHAFTSPANGGSSLTIKNSDNFRTFVKHLRNKKKINCSSRLVMHLG